MKLSWRRGVDKSAPHVPGFAQAPHNNFCSENEAVAARCLM